MSDSKTPITDAAVEDVIIKEDGDEGTLTAEYVPVETARQLERELDEMNRRAVCAETNAERLAVATRQQSERAEKAERELAAVTELHNMQLVAIMTAAICNTPDSCQAQRIGRDNPYWTVAYRDVVTAVQREINERDRAKKAEAELAELRARFAELPKVLDRQIAIVHSPDCAVALNARHECSCAAPSLPPGTRLAYEGEWITKPYWSKCKMHPTEWCEGGYSGSFRYDSRYEFIAVPLSRPLPGSMTSAVLPCNCLTGHDPDCQAHHPQPHEEARP